MTEPIHIEGGEVLASLDDRTVTGLLIPYGEMGRTNVGQFEVQAGVIRIPADPSVVTLNLDHDRFSPVGRATHIWEEPQGIMATFAYANTPEADAALAEARDPKGKRRSLSGEFRTGIRNLKATGGVLAAAAQCIRGAFPSAGVLAADAEFEDDETDAETVEGDTVAEDHAENVYKDETGREYRRVYDSETVETATGTETTTTITETITDSNAETDDTQEELSVTASALPGTQRQGAPTASATKDRETNPRDVFAALAAVKRDRTDSAALGVLAAFSDIVMTGTGALPTGGNVIRPNWLGKLYQGIPYEREYIDLCKPGTDISAGGKGGWTIHRGTASNPLDKFDGSWEGNKKAIKSGVGHTLAKLSTLDRFAFGNDIGREFYDLPGGEEVIEEFITLVVEDHLIWSDNLALDVIKTVAGTPVAPQPYPGVAGHDFPDALGQMIQGILAVKRRKADGRKDVPTFVIANEAAYEELLYTPKDLVPEFVKFTAGTDDEGTADGLRLVMGDTGIENTPSVIVGSDKAIDFDELAGGPLKIDALDITRGGIDKATHGYLQTFIVRPEAVVHIGAADDAGE